MRLGTFRRPDGTSARPPHPSPAPISQVPLSPSFACGPNRRVSQPAMAIVVGGGTAARRSSPNRVNWERGANRCEPTASRRTTAPAGSASVPCQRGARCGSGRSVTTIGESPGIAPCGRVCRHDRRSLRRSGASHGPSPHPTRTGSGSSSLGAAPLRPRRSASPC